MVRTKGDALRKAGGKAPKKTSARDSPYSVAKNGKASKSGGAKNPYCPCPIPDWQEPIGAFFPKVECAAAFSSEEIEQLGGEKKLINFGKLKAGPRIPPSASLGANPDAVDESENVAVEKDENVAVEKNGNVAVEEDVQADIDANISTDDNVSPENLEILAVTVVEQEVIEATPQVVATASCESKAASSGCISGTDATNVATGPIEESEDVLASDEDLKLVVEEVKE